MQCITDVEEKYFYHEQNTFKNKFSPNHSLRYNSEDMRYFLCLLLKFWNKLYSVERFCQPLLSVSTAFILQELHQSI